MQFTFQTVSRIVYGHGTVSSLGGEAKRLGCVRAVIVTDKGMTENNLQDPLLASLRQAGIEADVFDGVTVEPTPASIEESARFIVSLLPAIFAIPPATFSAK